MKTSVIEVRDMLSVLSVQGVEERIGEVPGVESVTVNFSAGNATVRYDETRLDSSDIKSEVRQRGYDEEAAPDTSGGHDHASPAASALQPASGAMKPSTVKPAKSGAAQIDTPGAKAPDKAAQPSGASKVPDAAAADHAAPAGGEKMSMPDKS